MVFPSLRSLTFFSLLLLFANLVDANPVLKRESRTSAPSGAVVVRASGAASGGIQHGAGRCGLAR